MNRTNFQFRSGTCDENVYRSVHDLNEYRLPDQFEAGDRIIDIGAHIGSFAAACLNRGAGKVFAFEPEVENFLCARRNLETEIKARKIDIFPVAVWRSDEPDPALLLGHSGYPRDGEETNTGGGDLIHLDRYLPRVAALPLLSILNSPGVGIVRLLKLDCEFSEWPILYSMSREELKHVMAICGEYHEIRSDCMPDFAKVSRSDSYRGQSLQYFLDRCGYFAKIAPVTGTHLGRFWAWRDGYPFKEEA